MYGAWRAPRIVLGVALLGSMLTLACETVTVSSIPVARIDLEPRAADLIPGQAEQLQAIVLDASGAVLQGRSVTWTSSDPTIAQVDAAGTVRAVGPGVATVSASSGTASGVATVSVSPPGRIQLSTSSVRFLAGYLGDDPAGETVAVAAQGETGLRDLTIQVSYDQDVPSGWLSANLAGTAAPTVLALEARASGLGIGTYGARVAVNDPRAENSPEVVLVTLEVAEPIPIIAARPDSLMFRTDGLLSAQLAIENSGLGELNDLTIRASYPPGTPSGWLSLSLAGTTAPTAARVNALPAGLAEGVYDASISVETLVPGVVAETIPVRLVVGPPPAALSVQPARLDLSAVTVSGSASAVLRVENSGGGSISALGKSVSYATGEPTGWLVANLAAGSTPTTMAVQASAATLAVGTYHASIEIAGNAPNSPRLVPVTFTVVPPGGTVPMPPSGLVATALASDTVSLAWTDASPDEDDFRVERSDDLGTTWSRIIVLPPGSQSYLDAGLAAGFTYQYRVQACNALGCSGYSGVATVTTPVGTSGTPKAPSKLAASAPSAIDVDLVWTDNSDDETGFEVEGRLAGGPWLSVGSFPANTVTLRVAGLAPGTDYEFRVRACNPSGCSKWSKTASVTTPNPTTVPAAPSGLVATSVTSTAVSLAWTDNANDETVVAVQRAGLGGSWQTVAVGGVGTIAWTDTSVASGQLYFYRVAACNPVGCSAFSNVILLLTP